MKLFMFRWADGETSIVGAPTRDEAFTFVDCEWADPHGAEVTEIKRFAMKVVPRLNEGEERYQLGFDVEVGNFGGSDEFDPLRHIAYPLVGEAYSGAMLEDDQTVGDAAIQAAFADEMDRDIHPLIEKLRKKNAPSKSGAPMMDILVREWRLEERKDAA